MNKIILIIIYFIYSSLFANEKSTDSVKVKKLYFYIGLNANITSNLNLNNKLKNANLMELNAFLPEFAFGLNYFNKKYSLDYEAGMIYSKSMNDNNEYLTTGFNVRLRGHYNFVNTKKIAFTSGLTIASSTKMYDIYNTNNIIDLNNLNPNNNNGHININNHVMYVGPSASFYFFRDKKIKMRFNIGYEFAITPGKYRSDFGTVANTINESGKNNFVFGISIL